MKWIDEMFVTMKADEETGFALKQRKRTTKEKPKGQIAQATGVLAAWKALTAAIAVGVNDFNLHPRRAGKSPVCMHDKLVSPTRFECDVLVPGMSSEMLVLRLDGNNSVEVSVHPRFPAQQLAITLESDDEGHDIHWSVGNASGSMARMSVQQLSEYVLKPILSTLRA